MEKKKRKRRAPRIRVSFRAVVRKVRRVLWWNEFEGRWDPDKVWSASSIEEVATILIRAGLGPDRKGV